MNDTRKIILKILLGCLAATAAAGVMAVLTASDAIGRVTGTAFFASICALLLLIFSVRLDKPSTFLAGLIGMVAVVIEFILGLALIWELPSAFGPDLEDSLMVTCWVLPGHAVAAMIYARLYHSPFTRVAGIVGFVTAGVALIASLAAAWSSGNFWEHDQLWGTAWSVGFIGILAVVALIGLGTPVAPWSGTTPDPVRGSMRHWRWIAVGCAALAAGMALWHIWLSTGGGPQAFTIILALGCWLALANVVTLTPLKPEHRWLGLGTLASAGVTALLCIAVAFGFEDETIGRFIAAAAIPTACGCMALIVMARLTRRVEFARAENKELRVTLICPRCRRRQDMPLGGAPCEGCGLRIEVKVEEPRCTQCGYMLYMLTGDKCPECGAAIATKAAAV